MIRNNHSYIPFSALFILFILDYIFYVLYTSVSLAKYIYTEGITV